MVFPWIKSKTDGFFFSFSNWKKLAKERGHDNKCERVREQWHKKANRYGYDRWHKTWNSRAQNWNLRRAQTETKRKEEWGQWGERVVYVIHYNEEWRLALAWNKSHFIFYDTQFEMMAWRMCLLCVRMCVCVSRALDYLLYHFSFSIVAMSSRSILKSTQAEMNREIIIGMKPINKRPTAQLLSYRRCFQWKFSDWTQENAISHFLAKIYKNSWFCLRVTVSSSKAQPIPTQSSRFDFVFAIEPILVLQMSSHCISGLERTNDQPRLKSLIRSRFIDMIMCKQFSTHISLVELVPLLSQTLHFAFCQAMFNRCVCANWITDTDTKYSNLIVTMQKMEEKTSPTAIAAALYEWINEWMKNGAFKAFMFYIFFAASLSRCCSVMVWFRCLCVALAEAIHK